MGQFIKKHNVRDQVFGRLSTSHPFLSYIILITTTVASKCGFDAFGDGHVTNSASHIKEYIEGTIERLGFAPDLYYLHRIDPSKFADYDNAIHSIHTGRYPS